MQIEFEKKKNNEKNMEQYYENQIEKVKNYYQLLLKEKEKSIANQLQSYLEILKNLKFQLEEANRDEYTQQTPELQSNSIENQLKLIKEENEKIIIQLKRKLIFQEQKMIELQKENKILKNEVNQLNIQK